MKVRPDLMITRGPLWGKTGRVVLVDFKTTSAQDYAHFVATIEQYDYDRQAALYSDLLSAARFIIIGVQKKSPFEVWQFELTLVQGLIKQGAKCIVPGEGKGDFCRSFQATLWEKYHTAAPPQRRQPGALSSKVQKAYKR
ncbi:PD-(D/E)XK nuclease-like domain-containing protein [Hymenobacter nivis]|uniref:PD-(D/E)XK nuclease-like domain-containing protein n=1 Tax=Hymenobacter nivis TaxID=1850093 RepID=UPI001FE66531|nr:PD-(D/E)XK nuclease-like domain-containing protein [Hymenobacter nivis]